MAIRNIVFSNDPLIRKKSRPVTVFDEQLWQLLDDMKETMYKNDGVGLAAPQVGVLKQVVVIEANNMFLELINPQITNSSGIQESREGCLSVKDFTGLVDRPMNLTVTAQDRYGYSYTLSVEGPLAIVCSHETDHLKGVLFIDKAKKLFRKSEEINDQIYDA